MTVDDAAAVVELYPKLSGSGGIDVKAGTLTTYQNPAASGNVNYAGTVEVFAGGTIKYRDLNDPVGLGTSNLNLMGGTLQNASGGNVVLGNTVTVGGSVIVNPGQQIKFSTGMNLTSSAALDVKGAGTLAVTGPLTGTAGLITVESGATLAIATSNPTFSADTILNNGTILYAADDSLGTGKLTSIQGNNAVKASAPIDPVLGNSVTIAGGSLTIQGQFSFTQGVTVNTGGTFDVEGAGTQVAIAGPVAGKGAIFVGGGTLAATGDNSQFKGTLKLQGGQAMPTITWPTPTRISAGTPLGSQQLDATASYTLAGAKTSVPGTFVYSPAAGFVPDAGTQTLSVTFTPTDTTDYATATATTQIIVVGPVDPSQTTIAASPSRIASGGKSTLTLVARDANGNQEPAGGLR